MVHNDIKDERSRVSALKELTFFDRFLSLWIILAMVIGVVLGKVVPNLGNYLGKVQIDGTSVPIAIGLLLMMFPVLAKVNYSQIGKAKAEKKLISASLILNWLVGPLLMYSLAWIFLYNEPQFRTGLILIGIARCIAMVLIWNELAGGNTVLAVVLVALNSIFQIVSYALLGWLFIKVLPSAMGLKSQSIDISFFAVFENVLIYLGIPLALGVVTSMFFRQKKGNEWYEDTFVPKISPFALYGLLFTIVVLFALQGKSIISNPLEVVKIALPLVIYFVVMFSISFFIGKFIKLGYEKTATLAFTAAGNNFELAIAVSISTFGIASKVALAGVVGPLIEVPVLVLLVYFSIFLRERLFSS